MTNTSCRHCARSEADDAIGCGSCFCCDCKPWQHASHTSKFAQQRHLKRAPRIGPTLHMSHDTPSCAGPLLTRTAACSDGCVAAACDNFGGTKNWNAFVRGAWFVSTRCECCAVGAACCCWPCCCGHLNGCAVGAACCCRPCCCGHLNGCAVGAACCCRPCCCDHLNGCAVGGACCCGHCCFLKLLGQQAGCVFTCGHDVAPCCFGSCDHGEACCSCGCLE
jgi:hypothetical protein